MSEGAGAPAVAKGVAPSILVVEDEGDLRAAIRDVLSMQGFWVDTAASGSEALRHVLSRVYQIVVSDIHLPQMDGFELTRLLRRRAQSPHVILITAYPSAETVNQAYAAGASHFMPKPIRLATLSRLVKTLAGAGAAGEESEERSRAEGEGNSGSPHREPPSF
jgi:DNA-binding response OmpR family regulator